MAKHVLSARLVQTAPIGDHVDGGGLFLRVGSTGSSWVFRYTAPSGRRRDMGLGPAHRATLADAGRALTQARDLAERAQALLRNGVDPLEQRRADRAQAEARLIEAKQARKVERTTLARVARKYHETVIEPQRTAKHGAQWIASLEQGIPPNLWHAPIDAIEPAALLEAMSALQARVPETALRVRQRLEVVFDDAIFHRLCTENPARIIKRKLAERPKGATRGHFAALDYAEVPGFIKALRNQPGIAARALEFALLTAARTGEVIGATWAEIDLEAGIWRIPGSRMKGGEEHTVHLSSRATAILVSMGDVQGDPFVFPSPTGPSKMLSNMAMLTVLRRMGLDGVTTVHGVCRATFSTWANETGAARPDVIEACLAHKEQDKVRRSYNRASFAAERRNLLDAWERYADGEQIATQPAAHVARLHRPAEMVAA